MPNIKFTKVDIDVLPSLPVKYKIRTTGMTATLPTMILFKNGEEKGIYPENKLSSSKVNKSYKEKEIIKLFDLETIYSESVDKLQKINKRKN